LNTAHIKELQKNDVVRKRLAKYMAQQCFRNTKLEDFHAGKVPESRTGDNSDVKVVSAREDSSARAAEKPGWAWAIGSIMNVWARGAAALPLIAPIPRAT